MARLIETTQIHVIQKRWKKMPKKLGIKLGYRIKNKSIKLNLCSTVLFYIWTRAVSAERATVSKGSFARKLGTPIKG